MSKYKNWKDLTMQEKGSFIREALKQESNIEDIKKLYNEYAKGGYLNRSNSLYNNSYTPNHLYYGGGVLDGVAEKIADAGTAGINTVAEAAMEDPERDSLAGDLSNGMNYLGVDKKYANVIGNTLETVGQYVPFVGAGVDGYNFIRNPTWSNFINLGLNILPLGKMAKAMSKVKYGKVMDKIYRSPVFTNKATRKLYENGQRNGLSLGDMPNRTLVEKLKNPQLWGWNGLHTYGTNKLTDFESPKITDLFQQMSLFSLKPPVITIDTVFGPVQIPVSQVQKLPSEVSIESTTESNTKNTNQTKKRTSKQANKKTKTSNNPPKTKHFKDGPMSFRIP